MTGRHLVLLLNNPFTADSRSWKIAMSASSAGWRVTVVARAQDGVPEREEREGFAVVRVAQPRPLGWLPAPPLPEGAGAPQASSVRDRVRDTIGRAVQSVRYLLLTRAWAGQIATVVPAADVWQSEGLITLPVAVALRRRFGGRVVYDSRDVHVQSARFARLPGLWRHLLAIAERRWARSADAIVTVSRPYADVLRRSLGVEPVIVMNGPLAWHPPDPPERLFHERLGLAPGTRVVLQLGAIQPHRGIEELVDAIGLVDDAVLVIVGGGSHADAIERRAAASPHRDRIFFLPPAAPEEIPALNASADVAVMPVKPSTLNHRLNTPTKLFDAIGAGTPVVASDLPGMAEIVQTAGNGVLCDPSDPADIARAIREVLDASPERRAALRENSLRAAREIYAWDRQAERLLALYEGIVSTDDGEAIGRPTSVTAAVARAGGLAVVARRRVLRRIGSAGRRLVPKVVPESGLALRLRALRAGGALRPRRPDATWRTAANRTLRTSDEAERAVAAVRTAGLVPHQDRPKNWDFLVALAVILDRVPPGGQILDAGSTQYSRLLPWLYQYGYRRLEGIDLTYDRPIRAGSIRYQRMDLTNTSFADQSFDAIACLSVIEHGVALDAYVREAARLLRPGGILVTSTDFWCEPVDTGGQEAYGVPIRIFAASEIHELLALAADHGLVPAGDVDLTCEERVVTWRRFGLRYTFVNIVLEKRVPPRIADRPLRPAS
jgi:glycosyltransferase involved in cell wall biosynthesis/SAM-dependent methyltransferase